jgi:octaheme c-type cytochrome (tetrathionate reductase family)
MRRFKQVWVLLVGMLFVGLLAGVVFRSGGGREARPAAKAPGPRPHLDHSAFFDKPFATGQAVTRACHQCHKTAAHEVMRTSHFLWLGDEVTRPRTGEKLRIGKKNLLNNFCLGIPGNWASCTRCHAGYGWEDESFDFTNPDNVDCLVCHDHSGSYLKGRAGNPRKGVDLLAAAKSVGNPRRDNCGVCHNYGGGGLAVKHGDLDATLDNPAEDDDVHMGRLGMTCIDCHGGKGHQIRGKAFSVSVHHENGIGCTDCHDAIPHADTRLNQHTARVACETCHIPTYAKNVATKMWWDWSKAGDDKRPDDTHHYLKIKGEFKYDKDIVPEYDWFNLTVDRYLVGDKVASKGPTALNRPRGSRKDPKAKIWPFKVHRGKQPFDPINRHLIPPVTSGEGGYWHEFDWVKALSLGAKQVGLEFSGEYGFIETEMYWPLSHMVLPKGQSLQCSDCHDAKGRLDWQALGYVGDPMKTGGD